MHEIGTLSFIEFTEVRKSNGNIASVRLRWRRLVAMVLLAVSMATTNCNAAVRTPTTKLWLIVEQKTVQADVMSEKTLL